MEYISKIPDERDTLPFPRHIAIMGCTGSIGTNTLRVLEAWRKNNRFHVRALAAGKNISLLARQADLWRPPFLAIQEKDGPNGRDALRSQLPSDYHPEIFCGQEGYAALASLDDIDTVVSAQMGAAGLRATVSAALAGKTICLANKESLVLAGDLLRFLCRYTGAIILPVDSEHFALFEGIRGRKNSEVRRLVLTASGGPFRTWSADQMKNISPEDALRHPSWNMGTKISIDSATLMNKGMEVIEACQLYQMPVEDVDVIVHPQSIIHSLVEFRDGSMMGHFAVPDMRVPIAGCLSWPYLLDSRVTNIASLDLCALSALTFEKPRRDVFPCLDLACRAFSERHTIELNAANEVAVARFLNGSIPFSSIPLLIRDILDDASPANLPSLDENDVFLQTKHILEHMEKVDSNTRKKAQEWHF